MKTHQITVRNVDPLLKDQIARNARLRSQSINDWVLDALRKNVTAKPEPQRKKASWTKHIGILKDYPIDQSVLDDFEKIDESMWQ